MKQLNIGCGRDIREGWVNLDITPLPGVDVVHDIGQVPLPFPSDEFDFVLCKDVLEHIDYVATLREIHRILKPGGKVEIQVPHFTSKDAYSDPTHIRFFSINTFRYFSSDHMRSYYFDFNFGEISKATICFDKRLAYFYNYLLESLVNHSRQAQNFYEGSPLRVFPATNIQITLVKELSGIDLWREK